MEAEPPKLVRGGGSDSPLPVENCLLDQMAIGTVMPVLLLLLAWRVGTCLVVMLMVAARRVSERVAVAVRSMADQPSKGM